MITKDGAIYRAFEGDFKPVNVFTGNNKVAGYVSEIAEGQELELEGTYNDSYEVIKIYGKSEQKAKWHQAEGVTSQVQEDGYNLLNCNVEWEPSAENQGISNIQSSVGSISFDYLHDHINYPYIRTKGTIHLKPGIYTISGIASGDPLDSVGFSQGAPDGYSQVVGDCNGIISIETEGDYHFYVYPMGEDRLASYELTNLMVTEGSISKTYQEYGYSKPSPAYPSELISHISAGSYQIPTENGIYEVTLTEDLRGLDDTYRDFIRFDSVSGTGYMEKNTLLVRMTRANLAPYRNTSDVTYRFSGTEAFAKYLPKTNASASILCNRLKRYHLTSELLANDIVGVSNYTESGMAYNNVYIFLSKSDIGITADDTADTMQEKAYTYLDENPLYILVGGYSYREELTFTKVESSTLPVLPWTAYGRNLLDIERLKGCLDSYPNGAEVTYLDNGYRLKNETDTVSGWQFGWQKNINPIKLEPNTDYTVSFDYKVISGNTWGRLGLCRNFIGTGSADFLVQAQCNADGRYSASFNSGDCDTVYLFMNLNNSSTAVPLEKEYTNIMLCKGIATAYEPFNPTPPESLIPSPNYPQQIYDLKDVTVTSRGRNLFDAEAFFEFYRVNGNNNFPPEIVKKDGYECVKYNPNLGYVNGGYLIYPFDGKQNTRYTLRFIGSQDIVGAGTSSGIGIGYSDGTVTSLPVNNTTEWEERLMQSDVNKTVVGLYIPYNYGIPVYLIKNSIVLYEGAYDENTHPPFDKYRCTSATIPIESCCMEIDETLYDLLSGIYGKYTKDGKYYVCDYIAIRNDVVTYVKCINDETLSASTPFIQNGDNRFFRTSSSFSETLNQPYKVLCQSTHLPGITHGNAYANLELGVSKVTHTISISKKGIFANMTVDDFNGWLGEQYDVGMPVIVRSILNIPVETDCTDTWAQDLLGLKTAPYYTKLYADKETGGLSVTYKQF